MVQNDLNVDRSFETVELTTDFLKLSNGASLTQVSIKDPDSQHFLTTQLIDENGDGIVDVLLFQPQLKALETKEFEVVLDNKFKTDTTSYCYSRFVPERTDDYAWENNKVAFRTYGPTAQKMIEENIKGGTLSSGIDAWLKKVDYPIINKWYAKTVSGEGTYHEDTGEGLDNFHVGVSRGVGGIAVKRDSTYYFSKNFIEWKTITTGPIRTSFELKYADWEVDGNSIAETKRISLDLGSNFSKFEIHLTGLDTVSAGLTAHEKDGIAIGNIEEGWVSYWEPHEESELGTAIIVPNKQMIGYENYLTDKKDESNLYAHILVNNNPVVYYTGFGWKEAGEFTTKESWEKYVRSFSEKIKNPLKVNLK